jgi:hypothetical protein
MLMHGRIQHWAVHEIADTALGEFCAPTIWVPSPNSPTDCNKRNENVRTEKQLATKTVLFYMRKIKSDE